MNAKVAATAAFAHLLGLAVAAPPAPKTTAAQPAPKIESDDDKKRDGESDEDFKKRKDKAKADADQQKADDEAAAAEQQTQAAAAERAELNDGGASAQARDRERARCRAIFATAAAGQRPDMAATVAFDTRMTATEAIAMLDSFAAGGAGRKSGSDLRTRVAAEPAAPVVQPAPEAGNGGGEGDDKNKVAAQSILAAAERARGGTSAPASK